MGASLQSSPIPIPVSSTTQSLCWTMSIYAISRNNKFGYSPLTAKGEKKKDKQERKRLINELDNGGAICIAATGNYMVSMCTELLLSLAFTMLLQLEA